ncbi:hypothetical protein V6A64_000373 [Enterobacter hormaechei]|uniref:hypothetical protein n=1 Tax=Enterobacter TaxID=547 RepID=UPI001922B3A3|nr:MULTISPECIES: hypothetical protein [Enterobacter]EMD1561348.1 hypothetical protein [Enterobacter hormaechei]EMD2062374.1 hypothetical protein [Enterobacter hormaechei]MBL1236125.1 hypothetical protein [Enterobacter hormaechei]MBY0607559.1 hypothetical protein [Enterobacter sp. TF2-1-2]MBY0623571.1 hypothetical protein [Enterobacter sp. TF5]
MNVKRYEWVACDEHVCHCDVVESAEGDMVDYEDYAALEARCAALAAENSGLKDEISNITFMRDDDFFGSTKRAQEVMGRLVNVKTPATDAFLAEVRAQGVEMFADSLLCPDLDDTIREFADELRKGVQS